jgi:hypothetical protein
MFKSLYKTNVNWFVFLTGMFLLFLIPGLSILSYIALLISFHQFLLLFYSLNYVIPTRYIFGVLMCVQFLVGPTLAYNGFDEYQYLFYRMQIPEAEYFTYAIPAMICFLAGLHFNSQSLEGEVINESEVADFLEKNPKLPFMLIGVGFGSSFIAQMMSSELGFVFYLMAGLKFIGVFMLICSRSKIKFLPMAIVYISIISSSLGEGMFHDLVTWTIFLGTVYAIRYKPSMGVKVLLSIGFLISITLIQLLKGDYRTSIRTGDEGIEAFNKAYEEKQNESQEGVFSMANLGPTVVRINQGFIVTNIMKTVPDKVPFEEGDELKKILEAALLPRFLAPDKLKAGDREIFTKYSGIRLREGTTMGLSSLGDAYINFGVFGGCIVMMLLGLLYNTALKLFYKSSKNYPLLLLFTPLVFYYPIRPDCEFQTILGHFFKSIFFIFLIMKFWRKHFIDIFKPLFAT